MKTKIHSLIKNIMYQITIFKNHLPPLFRIKPSYTVMLVVGLTLSSHMVSSQTGRNCGTDEQVEYLDSIDPNYKQNRQNIERQTLEYIRQFEQTGREQNGDIITIPIVFHIFHNGDAVGSGENISNALIQAQIDQLNDDFRRTNSDAGNTPADFTPVAADTEIQFCLATIDPNGNLTSGINRYNINDYGGNEADCWLQSYIGPKFVHPTIWDRNKYLNFYSVVKSSSINPQTGACQNTGLGYAPYPGGPANNDAVVCIASSCGSVANPNPAGAPYNKGRTGTHEVGHWLNLRHTWGHQPPVGQTGCDVDDLVADTPLQLEANGNGFPCTYPGPNSCGAGTPGDLPDMFQNYMDYSTDACMNLFTTGQRTRMRAAITASRPGLLTAPCNPSFDLALIKTLSPATPGPFQEGDVVTFDIEVVNQGDINAFSIEIDDYVPLGLTLADVDWMMAGGTASLNTPIPFIAVGATETVTITFQIDVGTIGTLTNDAEIAGADDDTIPGNSPPTDIDSTPGDNATPQDIANNDDVTDQSGGDDQDPEQITVQAPAIYDLALIKEEVSSGPYMPGDDVTFRISVVNQGNVPALNIEITDIVPTGMSLSANDANGWIGVGGNVTNTIASIVAAGQQTIDIVLTIDPAFTGTSLINDAEITADDGDDIDSVPGDNATPDDLVNDNDTFDPAGGDDQDPALINVTPLPPANDLCINAINVMCGDVVQGTTNFATNEVHDDCSSSAINLQGVWYKMTGNGTNTTISTCSANTNFDTAIRVLEGTCSNLVCSPNGFNDDYNACTFSIRHSRVDFFAELGKVYYIWVSPWTTNQSTGDFELSILCVPCNDPSDTDQDGIAACFDECPIDKDVSLWFQDRGDQSGNTSDYVEVPNDPAFNLTDGDFAFEAWVNPSNGDYKTIVSKGDGGGGGPTSYVFGIIADDDTFFNQSGKLGLFLTNGSGEWQFSNTRIPQNTWSHVAVSADNSAGNPVATFYFNGSIDGVKTFALSNPYNADTGSFFIGRQGAGCQCNHFDGRMDEVAIWDKTLSAADIGLSMAVPYEGTETGLVAYYDFNDADPCVTNTANTTLIDKANNHNGMLVNFALSSNCASNWAPGHNQGACEAVCLPNLNLTNTQSQSADYKSGGYISSDQTIASPSQVDYDATTMITLQHNFEVKPGAIFHAYINGCTALSPQEYLDAGFNVAYLLNAGFTVQDLIGLNHNGGIIFYINGSNGSGLVAASSDQSLTAEWGCFQTNVPGANATAIGTGAQNTMDIITAGCSSAANATNICADLSLNGYNDWYLPSIDELNELYLTRGIVGGFSTQLYWSSSEYDISNEDEKALALSFGNGTSSTRRKIITISVRAIRAF